MSTQTPRDVVTLPPFVLALHHWLSQAPPNLRDEDADVYAVATYSMLLALMCHAVFIGVFLLVGIPLLAAVNVVSVLIFVGGLSVAKRGQVNASLLIGTLEVICHAWLATVLVGWGSGFHFLAILAIVVLYLFAGIPATLRTAFGLTQIVAYVGLALYGSEHAPVYVLSITPIRWMAAMNITILLVVLMGICYYYAYAVGNARRKLRRQNSQLEDALQRLRDAQDQMVAQQKLAYLGTLTAGIAHEIKNPLNFVNTLSALTVEAAGELATSLDGATLTEELRETLDVITLNARAIRDHGMRADRVVQSMLLHAGQSSGQMEPTDLNALVMRSADLARDGLGAAASSVELASDLDAALPQVPVAARDVARVFLNVVGNGIHAVRQRRQREGDGFKPRIVVTTRQSDTHAIVRIGDNGDGIAADVQDQIFLPFFTTRPTGEGTGLGLSISHDIVVGQHRGRLSVASEPGQGAEFTIELPLK